MDKETIGKLIKARRMEKGLSQKQQYWVKCPCGYGKNYYIDCNYNKTGVHTKPW